MPDQGHLIIITAHTHALRVGAVAAHAGRDTAITDGSNEELLAGKTNAGARWTAPPL